MLHPSCPPYTLVEPHLEPELPPRLGHTKTSVLDHLLQESYARHCGVELRMGWGGGQGTTDVVGNEWAEGNDGLHDVSVI